MEKVQFFMFVDFIFFDENKLSLTQTQTHNYTFFLLSLLCHSVSETNGRISPKENQEPTAQKHQKRKRKRKKNKKKEICSEPGPARYLDYREKAFPKIFPTKKKNFVTDSATKSLGQDNWLTSVKGKIMPCLRINYFTGIQTLNVIQ